VTLILSGGKTALAEWRGISLNCLRADPAYGEGVAKALGLVKVDAV
jgi:hypothetical protein